MPVQEPTQFQLRMALIRSKVQGPKSKVQGDQGPRSKVQGLTKVQSPKSKVKRVQGANGVLRAWAGG